MLPGYTQDTVKELRKDTKREGMDGISPRFVQDMLSNALVRYEEPTLNPFMVMNEIERGLKAHSLITADEQRKRYTELIGVVRREYEDIIKNEVQRAISADETRSRSSRRTTSTTCAPTPSRRSSRTATRAATRSPTSG
jgi:serine protein kinase